jgi:hypothetical protein
MTNKYKIGDVITNPGGRIEKEQILSITDNNTYILKMFLRNDCSHTDNYCLHTEHEVSEKTIDAWIEFGSELKRS